MSESHLLRLNFSVFQPSSVKRLLSLNKITNILLYRNEVLTKLRTNKQEFENKITNCAVKDQANCTFSVKEPSAMNNGMTYIVSVGKKRKMFPHTGGKRPVSINSSTSEKIIIFWFSFKKLKKKNIFSIL